MNSYVTLEIVPTKRWSKRISGIAIVIIAFLFAAMLAISGVALQDEVFAYSENTGSASASTQYVGDWSATHGNSSASHSENGWTLNNGYIYKWLDSGNLYHSRDRVTKTSYVQFSGTSGMLYRNQSLMFFLKSDAGSPSHADNDFGMRLSGSYLNSTSDWGCGRGSTIYRYTSSYGNTTTKDFTLTCQWYADDGTYWAFGTRQYATDTDLNSGWIDIYRRHDTTAPTLTAVAVVDDNKTVYSGGNLTNGLNYHAKTKILYLSATDDLNGVNMNSLNYWKSSGNASVTSVYNKTTLQNRVSGRNLTHSDLNGNTLYNNGSGYSSYLGFKITGNGNVTIGVELRDIAGNLRTSYFTVNNMDNSAPYFNESEFKFTNSTYSTAAVAATGKTSNNNVWVKNGATVTFSGVARDSYSGINYSRVDGGSTYYGSNSSNRINTPTYAVTISRGFTGNTSGITGFCYDRMGYYASFSGYSVTNFDKTNPSVSSWSLSTSAATSSNVTLTVTAYDAESKVKYIQITSPTNIDNSTKYFDGSGAGTYRTPNGTSSYGAYRSQSFTLTRWQPYTITVGDYAGNVYTYGTKVTPLIDWNAPTTSNVSATGTANGNAVNATADYSGSDITVKFNASDPSSTNYSYASGIKIVYLFKANANDTSFPLIASASPNSSGQYVFSNAIRPNSSATDDGNQAYGRYIVQSVDNVGRWSSRNFFNIYKDDVKPQITAVTASSPNYWTSANQTVKVDFSFGKSGATIEVAKMYLNSAYASETKIETLYTITSGNTSLSAYGSIPTNNGVADNMYQKGSATLTVSEEGLRYYLFRAKSGTGVTSNWIGVGGMSSGNSGIAYSTTPKATYNVGTVNNGKLYTFNAPHASAAVTRIDKTAPNVSLAGFTKNTSGTSVSLDSLNKSTSFYGDFVKGHFKITDGRANDTEGRDAAGGSANVDPYVISYTVYHLVGNTKTYTYKDIGGSTKSYLVGNSARITDLVTSATGLFTGAMGSGLSGYKIGNTTANTFYTVCGFSVPNMYNGFNIKYEGTVIAPVYEFTVTDAAGNSTTFDSTGTTMYKKVNGSVTSGSTSNKAKPLYVDTSTPVLGTVTAVTDSGSYGGEWTKNAITYTIPKSYGMSGSNVYWYITDSNAANIPTSQPGAASFVKAVSVAQGQVGGVSGLGLYDSTTKLIIPSVSRRGRLWLMIKSGAGKASVTNGVNTFQIDATAPTLVSYTFKDAYETTINQGDWASTLLKLTLVTDDGYGSGVKQNGVTVKTGSSAAETCTYSQTNLYTIGDRRSAAYSISIVDNVGNYSTVNYVTFIPNVDTVTHAINAAANQSYDSSANDKRGKIVNGAYQAAIPANSTITISTNTTAAILSGATYKVYKADMTDPAQVQDFINYAGRFDDYVGVVPFRYNVLKGQGKLPSVDSWETYSVTNGSRLSKSFSIGSANAIQHYAYIFLLTSGSGLSSVKIYGGVFSDQQAPFFSTDKTYYELANGAFGANILADNSGNGSWTNSPVTAFINVTDYAGSGVDRVVVTKGQGAAPTSITRYEREILTVLDVTNSMYSIVDVTGISSSGSTVLNASNYELYLLNPRYVVLKTDASKNYTEYRVRYKTSASGSIVTKEHLSRTTVEDVNPYGNGFYAYEMSDVLEYTFDLYDKAGNSVQYKVTPMIDNSPVNIALDATYGSGTPYSIGEFVSKPISIVVTLSYGKSAFPKNETSFAKGHELYTFSVTLGNTTFPLVGQGLENKSSWDLEGYSANVVFMAQNSTTATYKLTITSDINTNVRFDFKNGVTDTNYVADVPGLAARDKQIAPGVLRVDMKAPSATVSYSVPTNRWTGSAWYEADVTATINVDGNDVGDNYTGSGLSKIKLTKKVNGVDTVIWIPIRNTSTGGIISTYTFTIDTCATYTVQVFDVIGNDMTCPSVTSNIDKQPVSSLGGDAVKYTAGNAPYTLGEWTSKTVSANIVAPVYASGTYIYLAQSDTECKNAEDLKKLNYEYVGGTTVGSNISRTVSVVSRMTNKADGSPDYENDTKKKYFYYKVVNGAGKYYIDEKITANVPASVYANRNESKQILIDPYTPVFYDSSKSDSTDAINYAVTATYKSGTKNEVYKQNTWTNAAVTFTLRVKKNPIGAPTSIKYSNNNVNWNQIGTGSTTALGSHTYNSETLADFYFSVSSENGLSSTYSRTKVDIYDTNEPSGAAIDGFGRVKIETTAPRVSNVSFIKLSEEDIIKDGTFIQYADTWEANKNNTYSVNSWSSTYVMMKIDSAIGQSGGVLRYYSSKVGGLPSYITDGYAYGTTFAEGSTSNTTYIILKDDQNKSYEIDIRSNANNKNTSRAGDGAIRIDKCVPFVSVALGDNSVKSVKWENDATLDIHKWFTSVPTLVFNPARFNAAGVLERISNISGSTVSYRAYRKGANDTRSYIGSEDWIDVAVTDGVITIDIGDTLDGTLAVPTYEFKIRSGAGLELYLSDYYHQSEDDGNGPSVLDGEWVKNLSSDKKGEFTIQVDTTDYSVTVSEWLKEVGDGNGNVILPAVTSLEMATVNVNINGITSAHTNSGINLVQYVYKAKRGDSISVSFGANAYNDERGYGYNYKRMNLTGSRYNAANTVESFESTVSETSTTFDIVNASFLFTAYFQKEIKVNYTNLEQTIQNNNGLKAVIIDALDPVTKKLRAVSQLQFAVNYNGVSYVPTSNSNYTSTAYNSNVAPTALGSYALTVSCANDSKDDPTYLVHNATGENFVMRYFVNNSATQVPAYDVFNGVDLSYVNIYSDNFFSFLDPSHVTAVYTQKSNLTLSDFAPIATTFSGVYDGNNYEVIVDTAIVTSGDFGVFRAVGSAATVKNLGVRMMNLTVHSAGNVGLLAGSVGAGARIDKCYAIGDLIVSGSNVNVGGLIGYVDSAILTDTLSDVSMSNKGEAITGDLGGLIGHVTGVAGVMNSYAVGAIELYNGVSVNTLKAATFIGNLEGISSSNGYEYFVGNKFLDGNLFLNEEVTLDFVHGVANDNVGVTSAMVEGATFEFFVDENISGSVARHNISTLTGSTDKHVRTLLISKIRALGMQYGIGTEDSPFQVASEDALLFIDKYTWAHYKQTSDIICAGEFKTIAAHKVFNGVYDGLRKDNVNGVLTNVVSSITGATINTTDNVAGIFGKVQGTIKNLSIKDITINVNYAGNGTVYVGGLAARLVSGSNLEMVHVLGNIVVSAPNATQAQTYVGGIVGFADTVELKNMLSVANVKTTAVANVNIGGVVGYINNSGMNTIYSLARVEGNYTSVGSVGAIAGSVYGNTASRITDYYTIKGNTYNRSKESDVIAGYVSTLVELDNPVHLNDFDTFRTMGYVFTESGVDKTVDDILDEIYPLQGKGTKTNPFLVTSVSDFLRINDFLYASYKITTDLDFTGVAMAPIGGTVKFTGSIDGALSNEEYVEIANGGEGETRTRSLTGLSNALVYHNDGTIGNLKIHINYSARVSKNVTFGAVAIYNTGTIQGVIVEGNINITTTGSHTAIVGGLIGESKGGSIIESVFNLGDGKTVVVSSMSSVTIRVSSTVADVGGFIGSITNVTELSYLVSNGKIYAYGSMLHTGTIAGGIYRGGFVQSAYVETTCILYHNSDVDPYVNAKGTNGAINLNEYRRYGIMIL